MNDEVIRVNKTLNEAKETNTQKKKHGITILVVLTFVITNWHRISCFKFLIEWRGHQWISSSKCVQSFLIDPARRRIKFQRELVSRRISWALSSLPPLNRHKNGVHETFFNDSPFTQICQLALFGSVRDLDLREREMSRFFSLVLHLTLFLYQVSRA